MKYPNSVYLLVLSGRFEKAQDIAKSRYSGCELVSLSKRSLREGGWKRQLTELRKLKGEALLIFADSIEDIEEPLLMKLTTMFHCCKETIIADSFGHVQICPRRDKWKLLPEAVIAVFADVYVFFWTLITLRVWQLKTRSPYGAFGSSAPELAILYPFSLGRVQAGGAMSHITGFLSGLAQCSAHCEVFSGRPIQGTAFRVHEVPHRRRFYLFRESLNLSYNQYFARKVEKSLAGHPPSVLYQRHGRYMVAGALLSRRLRKPLVLEYNGSEVWISKHWDPARFFPWLRLCEEISLTSATLITVVSEALRRELIDRGIPAEKIVLNPNGVDPEIFHPGCGGHNVRAQLGFQPDHVVIGFIGSFSYFHGIGVLQDAIQLLFRGQESDPRPPELRFILIGDGSLSPEIREALQPYRERGWVVFTGQLSHEQAPQYLDAANILVSPHVPNPDGTPFFGSPTKLFEYMAMGKAIVASKLDQLARVLTHQQTAWLIEPGNARELADAIRLLVADPEMRRHLGENARKNALSQHTWQQNAARVLCRFVEGETSPRDLARIETA